MDFRNKWAVGTVRTLLGLLFLAMSLMFVYFVATGNFPEVPGITENARIAEQGLMLAGITYVVKVVEIVAGFMLLINFRPAFATLLLAPIVVGIVLYDFVLWSHSPASLIIASLTCLATVYLGYVYWPKYQAIFEK